MMKQFEKQKKGVWVPVITREASRYRIGRRQFRSLLLVARQATVSFGTHFCRMYDLCQCSQIIYFMQTQQKVKDGGDVKDM